VIYRDSGLREVEKHRDSWRMWGESSDKVSAPLVRDPFIFAVPCPSIVSSRSQMEECVVHVNQVVMRKPEVLGS
jgi:hypothetical protein